VGIKYQPVGKNSLYTMALFDLTKTNVLVRDPSDPLGFRSMQAGEVGSRGAELEARTEILPGLNFIGNFTYQEVNVTKTTEEDTKNRMPVQIPNTTTSAWLDYSVGHYGVNWLQRVGINNVEWLRGLGIGGGVRYIGRVYDDAQNTSTTPAFTLFDATLRYDYGPWLFTINASNIFNNHYISAHTFGNFYLGTQRTIVGTLKFRF
jgi:iron complex outermembrane receptor protein